MADTLSTLLRTRNIATETARRDLSLCLADEAEAAEAVRTIDREIAAETDLAAETESDSGVEDFARWLAEANRRRSLAVAVLTAAETRSAEARAALAASHADKRAAQTLVDAAEAERKAAEARHEQAFLDEIGSRIDRAGGVETGRPLC